MGGVWVLRFSQGNGKIGLSYSYYVPLPVWQLHEISRGLRSDVSVLKYLALGVWIKPPLLLGSAEEQNRTAVVFAQAGLMTVFWFQPWKTNCYVILVKTPQRGKNLGFPVTRPMIFHNKAQNVLPASFAPTWHELILQSHLRLLHLNKAILNLIYFEDIFFKDASAKHAPLLLNKAQMCNRYISRLKLYIAWPWPWANSFEATRSMSFYPHQQRNALLTNVLTCGWQTDNSWVPWDKPIWWKHQ